MDILAISRINPVRRNKLATSEIFPDFMHKKLMIGIMTTYDLLEIV
jgi:hypothetical protein